MIRTARHFAFLERLWLRLRPDLPALLGRSSSQVAAWTLITVAAVYDRRSPHSLSATGRTRRGELIALCSVPRPVVPEPHVVLRSISLQPTQKVQEVRSDSLRSGNIAVLILVHAGGRLPSGVERLSRFPTALEAG